MVAEMEDRQEARAWVQEDSGMGVESGKEVSPVACEWEAALQVKEKAEEAVEQCG